MESKFPNNWKVLVSKGQGLKFVNFKRTNGRLGASSEKGDASNLL
jgi:hypothetical protein